MGTNTDMKAGQTKRKKFRFRYIIIILLGVVVLGLLAGFLADAPGRNELKSLTIGEADFTNLQDGVFVGEYTGTKGHLRDAAVKITVTDGTVTGIQILKGAVDSSGNPTELTKGITIADLLKNAVESKTLQVDAVSGATLTSKAHLKALENALKQAKPD